MTASSSQKRTNSSNYVSIPDANFRLYLKGIIAEAFSGDQLDAEHQSVKSLTKIEVSGKGIASLQGIEYFTALTTLDCSENELTRLDLRGIRSVNYLGIYRDADPTKSLKTLRVNEDLKDHDEIQKVKSIRDDAVIISIYNDFGQLSCYNYDPTKKVCVIQHAPWYNKSFYTKAVFDKEDSAYEIKDGDIIKCYNEDKYTLYLPERPSTSPASRVLVWPIKGQVTVSVRKDTQQYLLNGEIATKQLTLSIQGRPRGFLWDGTYWQVR